MKTQKRWKSPNKQNDRGIFSFKIIIFLFFIHVLCKSTIHTHTCTEKEEMLTWTEEKSSIESARLFCHFTRFTELFWLDSSFSFHSLLFFSLPDVHRCVTNAWEVQNLRIIWFWQRSSNHLKKYSYSNRQCYR